MWNSREPSPARFVGPPRAVHRRVGAGGDDHDVRFQRLDEQAALDHEYLDNLSLDLEGAMNLSASNELSVKWLRRTVDKQAKEMIMMQADFMKHIDEAKQKHAQDREQMYRECDGTLVDMKGKIFNMDFTSRPSITDLQPTCRDRDLEHPWMMAVSEENL